MRNRRGLIFFCRTPRTRKEICDYLGLSSITYAIKVHVLPLVAAGKTKMSIPDKTEKSQTDVFLLIILVPEIYEHLLETQRIV